MKSKILNITVIAALSLALAAVANSKTEAANNNSEAQIRMVASGEIDKIRLVISGSGTVSIDWGDKNRQNLSLSSQGSFVEHSYSSAAGARTVKIAGGGVTALVCDNNELTELDVSQSTYLNVLECAANRLARLDVSRNYALKELKCDENQLTELDLSRNSELQSVNCSSNSMSAQALDAMFESLHKNAPQAQTKEVHVRQNAGENDCKKSIATDKGWIVH